jgi:site-specific DNA-methyltransferase (adenine-specific)
MIQFYTQENHPYKIVPNSVIHGDCLDLMKYIPDGSIDFILTDLPYGNIDPKWDIRIPFEPLWEQYKRIIKPNSAIALFSSQPFTTELIMSNFKMFKYCWYIKKTKAIGFQHSKNKPMKIMEEVCIFSQAPIGHESQLGSRRMIYNPQGVVPIGEKTVKEVWRGNMLSSRPNQVGKKYTAYTGFPNDLLEFKQPIGKKALHPTQKSTELCEFLIKTYTNGGGIILDSCAGSGSTGIAAMNTDRNFILIEKDIEYFKLAQGRLENHVKPTF